MNFKNKKILISISTVLSSAFLAIVPFVTNSKNIATNSIMNKDLNSGKSLKASVNNSVKLYDYVSGSMSTDSLNNQYYSESSSGDSFAIFTSSNNSSPTSISKYDLVGEQQGKQRWTITLDELKKIKSDVTSIKAIKYSSGSLQSKGSLFILTGTANSSILFKADWETGNLTFIIDSLSSSASYISILNQQKDIAAVFEFTKIEKNKANTIKMWVIDTSTTPYLASSKAGNTATTK